MPRFELTIPPNTPIEKPISTLVNVGAFEFNREEIEIPRGHAYLAGLQVIAGRGGIIIPTWDSNSKWLKGDGSHVVYAQHIQLDGPQYILEFRGYNLDDTYSHTFYMDFE